MTINKDIVDKLIEKRISYKKKLKTLSDMFRITVLKKNRKLNIKKIYGI